MTITVDGEAYLFDDSEITSAMERELYLQSGLTVAGVGQGLSGGQGATFMIAALVFLARRAAGDTVKYLDVEAAITNDSDVDVKDCDEVGDAPEAPAAD